jgi:hypothetical protein
MPAKVRSTETVAQPYLKHGKEMIYIEKLVNNTARLTRSF